MQLWPTETQACLKNLFRNKVFYHFSNQEKNNFLKIIQFIVEDSYRSDSNRPKKTRKKKPIEKLDEKLTVLRFIIFDYVLKIIILY
jgi:hypothetical protein